MSRNRRFIIGGVIILAALSYIIYGGMQEAIVYFVTPSELKAKEPAANDKFMRMGGMVVTGSLRQDVKNLTYQFDLTMVPHLCRFFSVACRLTCSPRAKAQSWRAVCRRWSVSRNDHHGQACRRIQPHLDGKNVPRSFIPAKESAS